MAEVRKTCDKCAKSLPVSQFRPHSRTKRPRSSCRSCESKANSIHQKRYRETFTGPLDTGTHRNCTGCGCTRVVEAFAVNRSVPSGRATRCQICNRLRSANRRARERGYEAKLSIEQVTILVTSACSYCGEQGSVESPIGIDRIDNAVGYLIHNVLPCCIKCNSMKSRMSYVDFQSHVTRIAEYLG